MGENWQLERALREHAYAIGQSVLALATIEGMKVENQQAISAGLTPPYGKQQFEDEMTNFRIDHNSIIEAFTY